MKSRGFLLFLAFACIYFIWGSTFLAIRWAVDAIPPFVIGSTRFLLAGGIMVAASFFRRGGFQLSRSGWTVAILSGILMGGFGNGLLVWAEQRVPSGVASLWVASIPVWILGLNFFSFERVRPGWIATLGAALGCVGIALLPGASQGEAPASWAAAIDASALLFGSLCWSVGTLLQRRSGDRTAVVENSAVQMLSAGVFLAVISLGRGDWVGFDPSTVPLRAGLSLLYLSIFGSVISFSAYTYLIGHVKPQKVATYALVNPVIALLLGALLEREVLSVGVMTASALVLSGVALILWTPLPVRAAAQVARPRTQCYEGEDANLYRKTAT